MGSPLFDETSRYMEAARANYDAARALARKAADGKTSSLTRLLGEALYHSRNADEADHKARQGYFKLRCPGDS